MDHDHFGLEKVKERILEYLAVQGRVGKIRGPIPVSYTHLDVYKRQASMGSLLLAAGEPGLRAATPNSSVMVHQPSGGFRGPASDIERHAEDMLKTKRRLNEIYVKLTGQPLERVEKTLDRDHFMTPEEAKEFGLIDNVFEKRALPEGA